MKKIHMTLALLLFCCTISVSAQQKLTKLSQKIDVSKDVKIDLNTSYVQIEVDTWNKNTLEIEAYIEGEKLSGKELEEALKRWNIKVTGSGDYVKISSEGAHGSWENLADIEINLEALKALEVLGEMDFPEMPEMPEMPELPEMPEALANMEMPEMPEMPQLPELPEGINNVSFDTEAYKQGGEAYLEKWSKEYEKEYGKAFKEKMKAWGRQMAKVDFSDYEKRMEKWGEKFGKRFGEDYGKKMEAWGEEFGKRFDGEWSEKMEAWGEKYGKEMEKRSEELEKRMELREKEMEKREEILAKRLEHRRDVHEERQEAHEHRRERLAKRFELRGDNVKRTIKIKMPKKAKLNLNVRHGELKMSSVINNLKADISHATLVANHIDGSETSINVSYSPVDITTWTVGELNLKYVEDAQIETVERLILNSTSSDIILRNLTNTAIIDGSFGDLIISNIANTFTNLNIILENSEAIISLPKTDYSVYFKGNRSRLNDQMTSQKTIENYPTNRNSGKTIVLNAKYSDVILKD